MRITRTILSCSLLYAFLALNAWAAPTPQACDIPACPNYAQDVSWAAKPSKPDKPVDVFYVYPTIYHDTNPKNMDLCNQELRSDVQGLLKSQAGVYAGAANLCAPYYRQMSIACLDPHVDMSLNRYFRLGADDVQRAFNYYLTYLNQGRPFILAGHSQGSEVLLDLLRSRFQDPRLQKQLVAAYLIGCSVTGEDLKKYPWIKPAQGADDTGVVISWNTQAPGATGSPVLHPGAICINPLNWTADETPAAKSLNMGAVFFDNLSGAVKREVPHYTGARIDKKVGALVTSPPEKLDVGGFPPGVLHRYDYALWYRNLESNVRERIAAYLKKQGQLPN
ncbi:MAG: DUF3089 domain-containing protein [Deltaproteobacteria bacterium]|nr:DUF3089 domain-containing protein [Deltaproteobacteria bacterium]